MAASNDVLQQLHALFAQHLLSLLQPVKDEEGNLVPASLSAPEMAVVTKFLKDNNIAAEDDEDDTVVALKNQLRSKARNQGFSSEDVELALDYSQRGSTH